MTAIRRTLAALILGSAIAARPAIGQHGSSVSLTHTVTVTVPPRVKVEVGAVASVASSTSHSTVRSDALAVSVSATQAWVLSIGSAKGSQTQWSTDAASGFASVSRRDATIAAGEISETATAATLFFRNAAAAKVAEQSGGVSPEPVILTVAAP